jgi:hypothetical protein
MILGLELREEGVVVRQGGTRSRLQESCSLAGRWQVRTGKVNSQKCFNQLTRYHVI